MADSAATLEILIDIRARLEQLAQGQKGMRDFTEETKRANEQGEKFGALFKQGLGIGGGMEIASRAIELFRATVEEAFHSATRLASEVRDGSEALGITGEQYQVVQIELQKANVEMGRFSMAVASQTQSLSQARTGAGAAAEAYRALGLSAAQMEALDPAQRVLAVARAVLNAKDQTKAFDAAGQILGSRGLPQLLSGLKSLATEYDKVTKASRESGIVMADETAKRIDAAQKNIEKFKRQLAIIAGETLGAADMVKKSADKDFIGTISALLNVLRLPTLGNLNALAKTVAKNQPPPEKEEPATPGLPAEEVARRERLQIELRQAQVQLTTIKAAAAVADQNTIESDAEKAKRKIGLLQFEVLWRQKILELLTEVQKFSAGTDEEKAAALVNATAELATAKNEFAAAGGSAANFPAERIEATLALLQQEKEWAKQANENDPLGTEVKLREKLLPLLREEEELYRSIMKIQFPDRLELMAKLKAGTITPDELARLNQYIALQARMNANITEQEQAKKIPGATPQVGTSDIQQKRNALAHFKSGNNDQGGARLNGFGQGLEGGAIDFVTQLGTQGEQVAQALQSSIGTTVHGISDGIYGWITGTQSWADTMRNIGSSLLRTILDTIVQMGAQWLVNAAIQKTSMLGLFALGSGLRKAETTDVIANEAAKAPALESNAAASSIGSFGIAAAIGIAALIAAMAAFGGFREQGGDVMPGRAYIVGEKRPEVFWPDSAGTILPSLDALSVPTAARATSITAAPPVASSSMFTQLGGGSSAKPKVYLAMAPTKQLYDEIKRLPQYEVEHVDLIYRNRDKLT